MNLSTGLDICVEKLTLREWLLLYYYSHELGLPRLANGENILTTGLVVWATKQDSENTEKT